MNKKLLISYILRLQLVVGFFGILWYYTGPLFVVPFVALGMFVYGIHLEAEVKDNE